MKNKNLNWSKSKSGQGKRNITKIFTVGMVAAFFLYNTKMAQAAEMIKAS